ncbi:MAG: TetR/AcrR family transcriptional regulator [Solirubrobacteraceae bacterium]|nr:TetR/AcrR family transcriptional regulator [Patulibacter sp.]
MEAGTQRIDGRSLRYDGRREEILAAVTRYVLDHGVADLSLRPLADAVGVSHATLIKHFGSKEGVIVAVMGRLRTQALPVSMRDALPDRVDGAAVMAAYWEAWKRPDYRSGVRLSFEIYGLALHQPERYEDFIDGMYGAWFDTVGAIIAAAGCPADELDTTVTFLVAVTRGLMMDWLANPDGRDRVDAAFAGYLETIAERQRHWAAA